MRLTPKEQTVLMAWAGTHEEDNVLSFAAVSHRTAVPRGSVRRFVRALARKGLVEFCRMSWSDDGPCGAGYMATMAGYEAIERIGEPA
jgi:hypothetical protein